MTTQAIAAPPVRAIRAARLAGLAAPASLRAPVLLLFIASSALGFRLGTRG